MQPLVDWLVVAEALEELVIFSDRQGISFDAGIILQSLLIGNEPDAKVVCPHLRTLKVYGSTNWPSLLLRIMAERSQSAEELQAAGYSPDLAWQESQLPKPFSSEFSVSFLATDHGGPKWTYRSTSVGWKQFHDDYKEFFSKPIYKSPEVNHFDMTTTAHHKNSTERLEFLCRKTREKADAFRARMGWVHPAHHGMDIIDIYDEDDVGDFTDPEFWYHNNAHSDDDEDFDFW